VLSALDIAEQLPRLVEHLDEPVTDPALIPTWLLAEYARQEVTVVLTGEGADELFGGYRRHAAQLRHGWLGSVPGLAALVRSPLGNLLPRRTVQGLEAVTEGDAAARYLRWTSTVGGALAGQLFERDVLDEAEARRCLELAGSLAMDVVVEVHDEPELDRALALGARIIGINNRNLHNFREDLGTTERVRGFIPDDIAVVAASGIHSLRGMERMKAANVNAVLVGEALTTADDIPAKLRELQGSDTGIGNDPNGDAP